MADFKILKIVRQWVTGSIPNKKVQYATAYDVTNATSTSTEDNLTTAKINPGTRALDIVATFGSNVTGTAKLAVRAAANGLTSVNTINNDWGITGASATINATSHKATFTVNVGDLLTGGNNTMYVIAIVFPSVEIGIGAEDFNNQIAL